jgi:hypothetical protein
MDSAVAPEDKKHQSQRGLDWFAFFLADIQTGWGPFVAAYLTSKNWTQLDIGVILTVGCACRKSNPSVLVMQAAENRSRLDASY